MLGSFTHVVVRREAAVLAALCPPTTAPALEATGRGNTQ